MAVIPGAENLDAIGMVKEKKRVSLSMDGHTLLVSLSCYGYSDPGSVHERRQAYSAGFSPAPTSAHPGPFVGSIERWRAKVGEKVFSTSGWR